MLTTTSKNEIETRDEVAQLVLADSPRQARRRSRRAPAAGSACLVVSPDPLRRLMFGQAAERTGWDQLVCSDLPEALRLLASGTVGMVLVDVASPPAEERRLLVECLAQSKDLLTVVCGRSNQPQEEVWARELGAWMYLPGVAPESDIDPILNDARIVTKKLQDRRTAELAC